MLQSLGCIKQLYKDRNSCWTFPLSHAHLFLLLDNIASMSALVLVCVTATFYSSPIKSPLLSYCMSRYTPFTHGICTFIVYSPNWTLIRFYCLLFRVSFPILEHATTPRLERGDHLGWHCFFFVLKVFCLLVQSMTSSFVGKLCLMVSLTKVAAVASEGCVRVPFR